jgi:hypothetical protein
MNRGAILDAHLSNALGIIEQSMLQNYAQGDPAADSLHEEFNTIQKLNLADQLDTVELRETVRLFYQMYEDGRIDMAESTRLRLHIDALAKRTRTK